MTSVIRTDARRTPKNDALLDRAWLAWHALPRQPNGQPPSWRSIEHVEGARRLAGARW